MMEPGLAIILALLDGGSPAAAADREGLTVLHTASGIHGPTGQMIVERVMGYDSVSPRDVETNLHAFFQLYTNHTCAVQYSVLNAE